MEISVVLDVGTSSVRGILFNQTGDILHKWVPPTFRGKHTISKIRHEKLAFIVL
jgi:ribulose kinase